jgi:hypothetical protein
MRKTKTSARVQGTEVQVDRILEGIDDGFEYRDDQLDYRALAARGPNGDYVLDETEAVEAFESFEVLIEAMKAIAPLDKWKAFHPHGCPKADKMDARPFVVFCDALPGCEGGSHELALPFVRANDVADACSIVDEVAPKNHWLALDAMGYGQLMELADTLEGSPPQYPEGAEEEHTHQLMDVGWAVRSLKQGLMVRFHTWNPGEYVTKQGDRIVGRDGIVWRPSTREILENGWAVCRAGVAGGGDAGA